eukprot:tig00020510_g9820.t1
MDETEGEDPEAAWLALTDESYNKCMADFAIVHANINPAPANELDAEAQAADEADLLAEEDFAEALAESDADFAAAFEF